MPLAHLLLVVLALTAAFTDARTGRIPNWLTFPAIAIGPVLYFVRGAFVGSDTELAQGALDFGLSIGGILICGFVPYLLFRRGGGGGGDVKYFAAAGGILHPLEGLEFELWSMVYAALIALAMVAWQGKMLRLLTNVAFMTLNPLLPKAKRKKIEPTAMHNVRMGVPACIAAIGMVLYKHGNTIVPLFGGN